MTQIAMREEEEKEEEKKKRLKKKEEEKITEITAKKARAEFEEKFRPGIAETKPIIEVAKKPIVIEPERKVIEEYERKEALAVPLEEKKRAELIAKPVAPLVEPKEREKILKELVREERARQRELIKQIWDKVEEAMRAERKRGMTRDYVGRVIARLKITGILKKRLTSKIKELVKKLTPKMAG